MREKGGEKRRMGGVEGEDHESKPSITWEEADYKVGRGCTLSGEARALQQGLPQRTTPGVGTTRWIGPSGHTDQYVFNKPPKHFTRMLTVNQPL